MRLLAVLGAELGITFCASAVGIALLAVAVLIVLRGMGSFMSVVSAGFPAALAMASLRFACKRVEVVEEYCR